MTNHIISTIEESRSLSNILDKVHYFSEICEIKRDGEIIAKIIPTSSKKSILKVSKLNDFLKKLPTLDDDDQEIFANDLKEIRHQMNTTQGNC